MSNERINLSWSPEKSDVWRIERIYIVDIGALTIVIPIHYETDFTSVPRIFQNILPRWSDYARAALVHDYLYSTKPFPKAQADNVLFELMTEDKVNTVQKHLIYWAVKFFGKSAWDK